MNTVQADYAMLLMKIEKHSKKAHNACLMKKWTQAQEDADLIRGYAESLINWMDGLEDGDNSTFEDVRMPQPKAVQAMAEGTGRVD